MEIDDGVLNAINTIANDTSTGTAPVLTQQKRGRGRPRLMETPASKRTGQNRENQRAARERRQRYIFDLESKVRQLSQANNAVPAQALFEQQQHRQSEFQVRIAFLESECTRLQNEADAARIASLLEIEGKKSVDRNPTLEHADVDFVCTHCPLCTTSTQHIRILATRVAELEAVASPLSSAPSFSSQILDYSVSPQRPTSALSCEVSNFQNSYTVVDTSNNFSNNYPRSSFELFGMPDYRNAIISLKKIKVLANCKHVDELCSILMAQANCIQKKPMRWYIVRGQTLIHMILDHCTMLDRQAAIEILSRARKTNLHHENYQITIAEFSPLLSPLQVERDEHTATFRSVLTAIESLKNADDIVDQISDIIHVYKESDEDKFFRLITAFNRLQNMCTSFEDYTKLMVAVEVGRQILKAAGVAHGFTVYGEKIFVPDHSFIKNE
ncbi:hypothetical protein HK100_000197 [Physocladia obscura]|uniref:BZIP domain-containing protein n=1 Tax=Physocladia obscura TaxID=109957 RepID=A0AAD5XH47_9FUNG|nr:hypothetical protein HK100_000197 [Physocladia obscura]